MTLHKKISFEMEILFRECRNSGVSDLVTGQINVTKETV
jgi:hypothetical protein